MDQDRNANIEFLKHISLQSLNIMQKRGWTFDSPSFYIQF